MAKLTKVQQRVYDRVKAEGALLVRELSADENKAAHALKDQGILELDGLIASRGPFNQASQNYQAWVLAREHQEPRP